MCEHMCTHTHTASHFMLALPLGSRVTQQFVVLLSYLLKFTVHEHKQGFLLDLILRGLANI